MKINRDNKKMYIGIEIKRILMEKRFHVTILLLVSTAIIMTFPNFLPEKIDYINSTSTQKILTFNDIIVWKSSLGTRMMTAFLPLFPVIIYGHSLVDDIESGYANQIIKNIGYKKYYTSKLISSIISGGLCLFLTSILLYCLLRIIYFTGIDMENLDKALNLKYEFKLIKTITFSSKLLYVLFISSILFILGTIYASMGFLVSLFTNNKMLIYTIPIFGLRIYEDIVYLISLILSKVFSENYGNNFYISYSIFFELGNYNDGKFIFNSILLGIVIFMIIKKKLLKQIRCEVDFYEFKAITNK